MARPLSAKLVVRFRSRRRYGARATHGLVSDLCHRDALLAAQTELGGQLPVRFVAVAHQRNPITAIVRGGSDLHVPADLAGRRAPSWSIPWFTQEYAGALDYLGIGAPQIVASPRTSTKRSRAVRSTSCRRGRR